MLVKGDWNIKVVSACFLFLAIVAPATLPHLTLCVRVQKKAALMSHGVYFSLQTSSVYPELCCPCSCLVRHSWPRDIDTTKDPDALQDLVKRIRVSISQMCDVCDAANHVGFFGCWQRSCLICLIYKLNKPQCCDVSWSFLSKARVVGRLCRRFLPPDASHPVEG